jgi:hypothetical protein
MTLQCKKITVAQFKVKTRSKLAESSKEAYGSKGTILPITMLMMNISYENLEKSNARKYFPTNVLRLITFLGQRDETVPVPEVTMIYHSTFR